MRRRDPDRRVIAFHEVGHALVHHVEIGPVDLVTIRRSFRSLGRTVYAGPRTTRADLEALFAAADTDEESERVEVQVLTRVRRALAGPAADEVARGLLAFADIVHDRAAHNDAKSAYDWGLVLHPSDCYALDELVRREWRAIRGWLVRHWPQVEAVAEALLATETLDAEAFAAVVAPLRFDRVVA